MNHTEKPWLQHYEKGVPATVEIPDVTLGQLLRNTAQLYANTLATNFVLRYMLSGRYTVGGKISYRQLDTLVDRCANALYHLGVRKGDRVALMLPNSPHYVISFFAAMRVGAIVVNINPTYTARELKEQLVDSGAETIILLNLFLPRMAEIRRETQVTRVIAAHVFDTLPFPASFLVKMSQKREKDWVDVQQYQDVILFSNLLAKYEPKPLEVDVSPDDVALFQYTGGTTGLPKAAMLTHRNIIANVNQIIAWLTDCKPGEEKFMSAIPFFHVYGMTVCMFLSVSIGSEMVIVPNPRPIDNVMNIMQKERCTLYPGVPAMYIGIVNHPEVKKYDLHSIRACISGSAPLPMEVQERFGEITGGRLVEGFGMTEMSPVSHCNPLYGQRKSGSIGVPLPGTEAKIVDLETGADLPFDGESQGELCVRGPQVMKGYWNREEETTNAVDADGWMHTGDICKVDADGYFFIVDRKKDMINVSGFKVLPRDVEEVLFKHPKVLEAVVVGITNPARGDETVKAFVVLKSGEQATAEEIKEFCRKDLVDYKVPREVDFRDELPKTMVGKVLRRVLVEEEMARRSAPSKQPA
jgi:long-chain acyl-CoA synthetase